MVKYINLIGSILEVVMSRLGDFDLIKDEQYFLFILNVAILLD
jgi:hypothetical protein